MRILSGADIQNAIAMREAIESVRQAFIELSAGQAQVPLRTALPLEKHNGVTLVMPGYLPQMESLAVKIVSVHHNNPIRQLPRIHGVVLLLDSFTGQPLALMDGETLTALRTGAASGLATELLSRHNARTAAIIGAGVQARTQLLAICAVRQLERVWIYAPRAEQVNNFIAEMQPLVGTTTELLRADFSTQAIRNADIICTATNSSTPVFDGSELKPGVHINGIGSYTAQMRETDFTAIQRASRIVVDSRAAALTEAGDLIQAINSGILQCENIYAELGEIAAGQKAGRERTDEITFFKSVGNAAQDVAVAHTIHQRALQLELGSTIQL